VCALFEEHFSALRNRFLAPDTFPQSALKGGRRGESQCDLIVRVWSIHWGERDREREEERESGRKMDREIERDEESREKQRERNKERREQMIRAN
jgi:hypothetical protein